MLKKGEFNFDLINYKPPRDSMRSRHITPEKLVGFDSEADLDGRTLVFCVSDGSSRIVVKPEEFPHKLLTKRFRGKHFLVWNMKFEEGAIFQLLPEFKRYQLWTEGFCRHEGVNYYVVGNKHIRISKPRATKKGVSCCIHFWDLYPFYRMSLGRAAEVYLKEEKAPIQYDLLTREYYEEHEREINAACANHAELTRQLGVYLVQCLNKLGIKPTNLYSQASIAAEYFAKECGVEDVSWFWENERDVLRFACESYRGGKFEVTERGYFENLFEYDLVSAYPAEIADLVSLKNARVFWQKEKPCWGKLAYAFLRCRITIKSQVHHTIGINKGNTRIYPAGVFYATITYSELQHLRRLSGVKVEVFEGCWIMVPRFEFPFREVVNRLVQLKKEYKGDRMLYNLVKIILNGFYGKLAQLIKDLKTGRIKAGVYWNPIFASYITAGVRLKVNMIQEIYGNSCKAVHTDSVMLDKPMLSKFLENELGMFEMKIMGRAVLVSCGSYQIGKKCATRGFKMEKGKDWFRLLEENLENECIVVEYDSFITWRESLRRKFNFINKNIRETKMFDLNYDMKRLWLKKAKGKDLLESSEHGHIIPVFETRPFWEEIPENCEERELKKLEESLLKQEKRELYKAIVCCGGINDRDYRVPRCLKRLDGKTLDEVAQELGYSDAESLYEYICRVFRKSA